MFAAIDRESVLRRSSFTLPRAVEAFLDPVVIVGALLGCAAYFDDRIGPPYLIACALAFALSFPGNTALHERPRRVLRKLLINWLLFVGILGAFGVVSSYVHYFPQHILIAWAAVTPFALLISHGIVRAALPRMIAMGENERTAVVVGMNDIGVKLAEQFRDNPYLGTRIAGFFDDREWDRLRHMDGVALKGRLEELAAFVKKHHVDAIYLALPMATQPRILALLDDLKDTTASIYFVPDIFVTDLIQGRVDSVGGVPVVAVCETPFSGMSGVAKRLSDILFASFVLVALFPVMLGLALAVKLSSPGPIIFKQRRYGLDGKEILVYKFRSMTTTDNGDVVKQASRNDGRITPLGAFIRKTSLDELPQFVNVLQGRMSIVGPRPHAVAHNETYRKIIKGYMVRHKVKPGITGWAQVNGYRGETETVDKMEKRIEYDLEYLRNWSLGLDTWIIIKTVLVVARDQNAY